MGWYAIYTRPRHEKIVAEALEEKGVEAFLPLRRERRQWKDRKKWVHEPLFRSYVFVNIELKNKIYTLQTRGVVKLVGFGGEPAQIPDWQIDQLRKVLDKGTVLETEDFFTEGDYVEITAGALEGVRGYLREKRGESRLALKLDGIYQMASFVVDRDAVKKVAAD